MFRPRVIPCLLLDDLGLVKTVCFRDPTYVGEPINEVTIFNEACSDEIIFVDIMATRRNHSPNIALIQKIGDEAFMPFAVGGGIKNLESINAGHTSLHKYVWDILPGRRRSKKCNIPLTMRK